MSQDESLPVGEVVRVGFTPTGRVRHLIDDWDTRKAKGVDRAVCNSVVKPIDEMIEKYQIEYSAAETLMEADWCRKCLAWVQNMRHIHSMGTPTATPVWAVMACAEETGLGPLPGLAKVINMAEWKKQHKRS